MGIIVIIVTVTLKLMAKGRVGFDSFLRNIYKMSKRSQDSNRKNHSITSQTHSRLPLDWYYKIRFRDNIYMYVSTVLG